MKKFFIDLNQVPKCNYFPLLQNKLYFSVFFFLVFPRYLECKCICKQKFNYVSYLSHIEEQDQEKYSETSDYKIIE